LQFWFKEDHLVNKEPFEFWFCQREAIETLIYVYEVVNYHALKGVASCFIPPLLR